MKKEMRLVQCTVNGRPVAEYVDVRESLLEYVTKSSWTYLCEKRM